MQYIIPRTAAESQISITTVVTLFAAVNTAGSTSDSERYYMTAQANAVQITVESGSIRWLEGVNPTATVGNLISGGTVTISGINLSDLRLVSTSGTAVLTVQFIRTNDIVAIVGGGGSSSGGTASSPAISGLVYNTVAPSLTNGQTAPLQGDSQANELVSQATTIAGENLTLDALGIYHKPIASSTTSASRFQNLGANTTLNVKATTGNVFAVYCENLNAAVRYIQLHNTATTPAGGATPYLSFRIPATSSITIGTEFFGENGLNLSTGIAFAYSTTATTYTAATAAEQLTQITYI